MSLLPPELDRRIIPRWRDSATTAQLGELDDQVRAAVVPLPRYQEVLAAKVEEFRLTPTLPFAADVVGTALAIGLPSSAQDAARLILDTHGAAPPARAQAARVLGIVDPLAVRSDNLPATPAVTVLDHRIRTRMLKARVRTDPHDALAHADLALEYAALGQVVHSMRHLSLALSSYRSHRYFLRSAARLYVHAGDVDMALQLLRRAPVTRHDPWLVAAEVATSDLAGRPSRFVKSGYSLLASGHFAPYHLSELASALATLEAVSGASKRARVLYRQSLRAPTDNSVAQAQWASKRLGLSLEEKAMALPMSFEARSNAFAARQEWPHALSEAVNWLHDQPFSREPAIVATYVASVALEDYATAIEVGKAGLTANPRDWLISNNLAFSYASAGELAAAEQVLNGISEGAVDTQREATLSATRGLLAFRHGSCIEGRKRYECAYEQFAAAGDRKSAALAAVYQLREEIRSGSTELEGLIGRIEALVPSRHHNEVAVLFERFKEEYRRARSST